MRILFADDDEVTLFLYKRLLKALPEHEGFLFSNGKEVLEFLEKGEKADILFLDMNMPVLDGHQFLENYFQNPNIQGVKSIYIMVGSELVEAKKTELAKYKLAGFQSKPLRREKLQELIAKELQ